MGCGIDLEISRPRGFFLDAKEDFGVAKVVEGVDESEVVLREGMDLELGAKRELERGG